MQTDSARDITLKAGDAEAHVGRVAERRQHKCRDADDNAGQNDEQILFFHVLFPPILSNRFRLFSIFWNENIENAANTGISARIRYLLSRITRLSPSVNLYFVR